MLWLSSTLVHHTHKNYLVILENGSLHFRIMYLHLCKWSM
jgi:hypothetical protein